MSDVHVHCIDVRAHPEGGLLVRLRLVETQGLRVEALLLRYDVELDPFAVCAPIDEEERLLEQLAMVEDAEDGEGPPLRLCGGAVVVQAFQATTVTDVQLDCTLDGAVADCMDAFVVGQVPLRLRFRGDAFVSGPHGPELETALLDEERLLHLPPERWRAARTGPSGKRIIDLADRPALR